MTDREKLIEAIKKLLETASETKLRCVYTLLLKMNN